MNLGIYRQIFEKSPNTEFHEYRPVGGELFHANGKTDTHDEAKSSFLQFCERVYQDASCCATLVLPTITTPQRSYVKSHHNTPNSAQT